MCYIWLVGVQVVNECSNLYKAATIRAMGGGPFMKSFALSRGSSGISYRLSRNVTLFIQAQTCSKGTWNQWPLNRATRSGLRRPKGGHGCLLEVAGQ